MANQRARRLDRAMLQEVSRRSETGMLSRTPGLLSFAIGRFRRWQRQRVGRHALVDGRAMAMLQYQELGHRLFAAGQ
eukprot:3244061-Lingulodinium_polyedra.AAC.1